MQIPATTGTTTGDSGHASPMMPYRASTNISSFPRRSTASANVRKSFLSFRTTASAASYGAMRSFGEVLPVTVEAKSLSVWGGKETAKSKGVAILKDVSLTVPAGQLLAILGGSGSGKTTLLNALAGRTDRSKIAGQITYNGQPPDSYISGGYVAYVQQQVRETLRYAARLRLPRTMSKAEKYSLVEAAISELGLRDCANTIIGDEWRKGVSGGERRRVTVAVQLLMNPSVILMDEPTTGLDAWTSHNLVRTLLHLCRKGRTIIMSIHQPRSTTFSLFHSIALLAKGDVIFSGPSVNLEPYFASIGLGINKSVNPAEFLIDLTSVDTRDKDSEHRGRLRLHRLVHEWKFCHNNKKYGSFSDDSTLESSQRNDGEPQKRPPTPVLAKRWTISGGSGSPSMVEACRPKGPARNASNSDFAIAATSSRSLDTPVVSLAQSLTGPTAPSIPERRRSLPMVLSSSGSSYTSSSQTTVRGEDSRSSSSDLSSTSRSGSPCSEPEEPAVKILSVDADDPLCPEPVPVIQRISFFEEVNVLTHRAIQNLLRDRLLVWGTLVESLLVGLITGGMFWRLEPTRAGIIGRQALIGTVSGAMNFLLMTFGCFKLTSDFRVFDRERKDKMYRVESFLLSSIITNSILFILHGAVLAIVIYPMSGLRTDFIAMHFGIHLVGMILMHICTLVWSHLFVAVTREFSTASVMLNFVCAFLCTSTGYLIPQTVIPQYLKWVNTISYFSAGYRLLVSNEFSGNSFSCPELPILNSPQCEGKQILIDIGLEENDYIIPFINMFGNIIIVTLLVIFLLYVIIPGQSSHRESILDKFLKYFRKQRDGRSWWCLSKSRALSKSPVPLTRKLNEAYPLNESKLIVAPLANEWDGVMIDVTVENLTISITPSKQRLCKKNAAVEQDGCILDGISTSFRAGELNVIMGSSGAGKTTLLNALMARNMEFGRSSRRGNAQITGRILYGGLPLQPSEVSVLCSYVCQDDLHHLPALTARETLRYAALLRLPSSMTVREKIARAEEVLLELGLKDCADVPVGDEMTKGLSGGEKRRLSIGIQTITNPKVLILDEPTSGLDAFSSHMVMLTLKRIAATGKTVICTIHQPRSDLVDLFDNLVLLARGGKLVYSGPMHKTLAHFTELGYTLPPHTNPADFFLDLSSVDLRNVQFESESRRRVDSLVSAWNNRLTTTKSSPPKISFEPRAEEIVETVGLAERKALLKADTPCIRQSVHTLESVESPHWLRATGVSRTGNKLWAVQRSGSISKSSDAGAVESEEVNIDEQATVLRSPSVTFRKTVDAGIANESGIDDTKKVCVATAVRSPSLKVRKAVNVGIATDSEQSEEAKKAAVVRSPSVKFRNMVDVGVSGDIPLDTHTIGQKRLGGDSMPGEETGEIREEPVHPHRLSAASFGSFVDHMYSTLDGGKPPPRSKRGSVYPQGIDLTFTPVPPLPIIDIDSRGRVPTLDRIDELDSIPTETERSLALFEGDSEQDSMKEAELSERKREKMDLIARFVREQRRKCSSSFAVAVPVLLSRMGTNLMRQLNLVGDRLGTVLGFALIVSLYCYKLDLSEAKVQARLGVLHEFTALIFMAMMTNVSTFGKDLALYRFDRADNAYSLESFLVAGMLTELPYQIFTSVTFSVICMFLFGLQASVTNFLVFAFVAFAMTHTGESIGISFCALVRNSPFTVQVMSALITVVTLLSGFLSIAPPVVLDRMNYVSVVRYASHAIGIAEFRGTAVICPQRNQSDTSPFPTTNLTGPVFTESLPQISTVLSSVVPAPTDIVLPTLSSSAVDAIASATSSLPVPSFTGGAILVVPSDFLRTATASPSPTSIAPSPVEIAFGGAYAPPSVVIASGALAQTPNSIEAGHQSYACRFRDGDDVLALLGFEGLIWQKLTVVAALTISYRFVAYLVLKFKIR
ncbi:hypothetical protein HDU67_007919 [Dinochytrium kinnereticum]|nr:hypothetical protein HDU67_007919 [Dinochytrium kinnereticum]